MLLVCENARARECVLERACECVCARVFPTNWISFRISSTVNHRSFSFCCGNNDFGYFNAWDVRHWSVNKCFFLCFDRNWTWYCFFKAIEFSRFDACFFVVLVSVRVAWTCCLECFHQRFEFDLSRWLFWIYVLHWYVFSTRLGWTDLKWLWLLLLQLGLCCWMRIFNWLSCVLECFAVFWLIWITNSNLDCCCFNDWNVSKWFLNESAFSMFWFKFISILHFPNQLLRFNSTWNLYASFIWCGGCLGRRASCSTY